MKTYRAKILKEIKSYFKIKELVCSHTYAKYGEAAWRFLDTKYLHTILVMRRDILKVGMLCNHGGSTQRGTRCNLCQLVQDKTKDGVLYLSGHIFGKAGDFNTVGNVITAPEMRKEIERNARLLPYPIRLEENAPTWMHIDVMETGGNSRITYFRA